MTSSNKRISKSISLTTNECYLVSMWGFDRKFEGRLVDGKVIKWVNDYRTACIQNPKPYNNEFIKVTFERIKEA